MQIVKQVHGLPTWPIPKVCTELDAVKKLRASHPHQTPIEPAFTGISELGLQFKTSLSTFPASSHSSQPRNRVAPSASTSFRHFISDMTITGTKVLSHLTRRTNTRASRHSLNTPITASIRAIFSAENASFTFVGSVITASGNFLLSVATTRNRLRSLASITRNSLGESTQSVTPRRPPSRKGNNIHYSELGDFPRHEQA